MSIPVAIALCTVGLELMLGLVFYALIEIRNEIRRRP